MKFAPGFKKFAEKVAADFRGELNLAMYDRFDPFVGANSLGIPVISLEDLRPTCDLVHLARMRAGTAFSALTVVCKGRALIVYNDGHTVTRINNSISHELAHALLQHEPQPFTDGVRIRFQQEENEADHLAGLLLIPDSVAIRAARDLTGQDELAASYGVSSQLLQFRINISGARRRALRARFA